MNLFAVFLFSLSCLGCCRRVSLTLGGQRQSAHARKPVDNLARLLVTMSSPAAGWQTAYRQPLRCYDCGKAARKPGSDGHLADVGSKRKYESLRPSVTPRTSTIRNALGPTLPGMPGGNASEVDWDAEFRKLPALNPIYRQISAIEPSDMVAEFVKTAPLEMQHTVKATIASLFGTLPEGMFNSQVTTTRRNLASLMFNMQMTGYMFKEAEFKMSLQESLLMAEAADEDVDGKPSYQGIVLPAVKGNITVSMGQGMETTVDAAAYMSELRAEVETLRTELIEAKKSAEPQGQEKFLVYLEKLNPIERTELTMHVSKDVLETMSQLVSQLLGSLSQTLDAELEISTTAMRELLLGQLVSGYRLRDIEIREEYRKRFFDR